MKAFRATGTFTIFKQNYMNREQPFSFELAAKDEADAAHTVLSTIGSRHSIIRKNIHVTEIVPLKSGEITDLVVKHQLGGK